MSEREIDLDMEAEDEGEEEQEPDASSPYAVLGVEPDASPAQVRIAYHRHVREHPPERDPEGFKRIREAYETLRSPRKRAELALLELRHGPAEFDLDRLRDAPPPPFPEKLADHLLAVALAVVDAALDDQASRALGAQHPDGDGQDESGPTGDAGEGEYDGPAGGLPPPLREAFAGTARQRSRHCRPGGGKFLRRRGVRRRTRGGRAGREEFGAPPDQGFPCTLERGAGRGSLPSARARPR